MEKFEELEAFVNHYKNIGYFGVIKAIENLIARNKELEKENNNLRDTNKKLYELCQGKAMQEFINEDYIPKSKVREKIEEYEELVKDFEEYWSKDPRKFKRQKSIDYYKLEALKELLQKGDK